MLWSVVKLSKFSCWIQKKIRSSSSFDKFEYTGNLIYGDYGPARKEVQKESKIENYNLKLSFPEGKKDHFAIVSENGKSLYLWGDWNSVGITQWVSDVEFEKLNLARESFDRPSCPHYEIQPQRQGKLLWLSGKFYKM